MANIQQKYQIGVPFETYTTAQLSTNDWKWTYRTLVGFRKENGEVISVGDQTSFDEDRAQVSGVWELDKFQGDPLKIYFIGTTGSVSATVIEHSETLPLANAIYPQNIPHGVFDSSQSSASISGFYMTEAGAINRISVVLSCAPGTYLNRIYGIATNVLHEYEQHTTSSLLEYINPFPSNLTSWSNGSNSFSIDNVMFVVAQQFKTLSVDFTSSGILEYIPNKNTLNPDLR